MILINFCIWNLDSIAMRKNIKSCAPMCGAVGGLRHGDSKFKRVFSLKIREKIERETAQHASEIKKQKTVMIKKEGRKEGVRRSIRAYFVQEDCTYM